MSASGPAVVAAADVVLAVEVGGTLVRTAVVGPDHCDVQRLPTVTATEPWSIERLVRIATDLHDSAVAAGWNPMCLVVAVPGQVDEYHGVVQYSATLPWHDVPVADRVGVAVNVPVLVRHTARVAALAEANLTGDGPVDGSMLYVSVGTAIVAAGAQSGTVVTDHVGAGDLGRMRVRSGPGAGRTLEDCASTGAIARDYAAAAGVDPASVDAAAVHARISSDPVARRVFDDAVDALADGLDWALLFYGPRLIVVGGGLVNAGDDLMEPLVAGVARRAEGREVAAIRAAAFGDDAGWVGAALAGARKIGWPTDVVRGALARVFGPSGPP